MRLGADPSAIEASREVGLHVVGEIERRRAGVDVNPIRGVHKIRGRLNNYGPCTSTIRDGKMHNAGVIRIHV